MLTILVLADQIADVFAAGPIATASDLFIHKGFQRVRQRDVHRAHRWHVNRFGKICQDQKKLVNWLGRRKRPTSITSGLGEVRKGLLKTQFWELFCLTAAALGAAPGFRRGTGTEESIADLVAALPITRIVVAHRAALLARVGRVLLLCNGRLEEVTLQKQHADA